MHNRVKYPYHNVKGKQFKNKRGVVLMYGYDNAPMPVQGVQGTMCHGGYPYAGVGGAGCGYGYGGFALIVVLFILLIIIGACCTHIW